MGIQRMDNVAIVVKDLDGAVDFFTELGMELEGRTPIEGSSRIRPLVLTGFVARSP